MEKGFSDRYRQKGLYDHPIDDLYMSTGTVRENPNFIKMYHGKLEINVPRSLFKGSTSEMIEPEVAKFRAMVSARYPWLSKYALDEVIKEAKKAMEENISNNTPPSEKIRDLLANGRIKESLRLAEQQLIKDPDDADLWYVAAELLCKVGRMEEGYNAMKKAKDLSGPIRGTRRRDH